MFGTKNIIPSPDLPASLNALQSHLGSQSPFESAEQMIDLVTLYPYHRPFLSLERHERVEAILLGGEGDRLKTLLGRVANGFGANPSLRYCWDCWQNDVRDHGAPYWHRIHQLPGVISCAKHGIELISVIWPSASSHRQRIELVPVAAHADSPSHKSTDAQIVFARTSADLLSMNLPILGPDLWAAAYKAAASKDSFSDANGRIRYARLAEAVRGHYDDFAGFLHKGRILSTPKHPLAWLHAIFERPNRSSHPIFHLLLIGFFFGTVERFVAAVRRVPEKNEQVLSLPTENGQNPDAELLRDESRSARAVAGALGLSVSTVVSRRRALGVRVSSRRKTVGAELLTSLKKALREGKRAPDVVQKYGVSLATVYRVRRETPSVLTASLKARYTSVCRHYRSRWRAAARKSKAAGVTERKRRDPAAYAWLYRNDREWLFAKNSGLHKRKYRCARIDWAARDTQLCEEVKTVYESLRLVSGRGRISRTALIRLLGEASVSKNLARLPHLKSLLAELEESREQYQMYRVNLAINTLLDTGIEPTWWRVQRVAGLRIFSSRVRSFALARISEAERK